MLTTSLLIDRERNWRLYAEHLQDALEARDVTIEQLKRVNAQLIAKWSAAADEVKRLERLLKIAESKAAQS